MLAAVPPLATNSTNAYSRLSLYAADAAERLVAPDIGNTL
jgi:hypothetical protein